MGYTSSQVKDFVKAIAPIVCAEADKRGYAIRSTAIAQAIIEGAAGTSLLAKRYHNHFGMKCGSTWKGKSVNLATKEEYSVGTLTSIKANFRAYDDDVEGIAGYYDFIQMKRYANLRNAKDYVQYAQYLKSDGWATSSTYVNTLVNTVKRYSLQKFDKPQSAGLLPIAEIANEVIANKWGNGEDRKHRLEAAGYNYREVQDEVNRILKG